MKEVFEKRSARMNSRLMEKWGYKRDDIKEEEKPLESPLVEEEEIEEGTYGGNMGDQNTSAVHGEKSLKGAKDYEPIFEEEICEECPERPPESPLAEMTRTELKKALLKRGE